MTGSSESFPTGSRPLRVLFFWNRLSGYFSACLRALQAEGADVTVVHRTAIKDAPFKEDHLTTGLDAHAWSDAPDSAWLREIAEDVKPDALIVCSWHITPYRKVARQLRGQTLRVLAMDNQWLGTLKQRAGVAAAPWMIRPAYDAVLLPGETQAAFARRLGFETEQIIPGMYCCDHEVFSQVATSRGDKALPETFVFTGRLVHEKAIDVLAQGYAQYRELVTNPWPLHIAGTGPDEALLSGIDGVKLAGFVQPDELPSVFEQAGCLVLPSRFEPWGVVVHEAAAAGLPIVCSSACGASTRLVLDGYNGAVISPDNPQALAHALSRIHQLSDDERRAWSEASRSLANQYTPQRWASNLVARITALSATSGTTS